MDKISIVGGLPSSTEIWINDTKVENVVSYTIEQNVNSPCSVRLEFFSRINIQS